MSVTVISQEDKFAPHMTNETVPTSTFDPRSISLTITWRRGFTGSNELASRLKAIGFNIKGGTRTVAAWAPENWTHELDTNNVMHLFDETGMLRATYLQTVDQLPVITLHTRISYGYSTETNLYYAYDQQTGVCLKSSASPKRVLKWLKRYYPEHANPAAYRNRSLSPNRWWKI